VTGFPEFPNTHNKLADRYHLSRPLPNYFFGPFAMCYKKTHIKDISLSYSRARPCVSLRRMTKYFF
jgi:hypothetical protein